MERNGQRPYIESISRIRDNEQMDQRFSTKRITTPKQSRLPGCDKIHVFQYTDFYSCHPPGVKKGFIKGEALRLLRTNSSVVTFNINMQNFKTRLKNRGYPNKFSEKFLSEVNFTDRERSLEKQRQQHTKENIAFCYAIPPGFT